MTKSNRSESFAEFAVVAPARAGTARDSQSPGLFLREARVSDRSRELQTKRFFQRKDRIDRFAGVGLLLLTAPVTLGLFVLVKLTSPGPGFYRQRRVGLNGKTFEIVKLRSMVQNAELPGEAVWCVKNDSRVTGLGKVLRKLHLDELPQLWNVARGEMSLVGPRPERPEICKELNVEIENYYDRVMVKPGVTGLSQINLPPDETLADARRKQILDLQYIEEANPWLEFRILTATAMRMFGIKGETVMKAMRLCRRNLLVELGHAEPEPASTEWDDFDESSAELVIAGSTHDSYSDAGHPRHPR